MPASDTFLRSIRLFVQSWRHFGKILSTRSNICLSFRKLCYYDEHIFLLSFQFID